MSFEIQKTLDLLKDNNINPDEANNSVPIPEIGQISENDDIIPINLNDVIGENEISFPETILNDLERIIENNNQNPNSKIFTDKRIDDPCAWYQPIHYFGRDWGIFIREECLIDNAFYIASYIDWSQASKKLNLYECARALLRCSFYEMYFHEQYHHKVESFGLRLLVTNGMDNYRMYKSKVYRPNHMTDQCLEEALANAEIFQRIKEKRYKEKLIPEIQQGFLDYLYDSILSQPPGYNLGLRYRAKNKFSEGERTLQSQIFDAKLSSSKNIDHWETGTYLMRSLADITKDIFVVLPHGRKPIINSSAIDPRGTISSREMEKSLIKNYKFKKIKSAGKGSHVKLKHPNGKTVILSGNRRTLPIKDIKDAIEAITGGRSLNDQSDLLSGRLSMI